MATQNNSQLSEFPFETSTIPMIILDKDDFILNVSNSAQRVFDLEIGKIKGVVFQQLINTVVEEGDRIVMPYQGHIREAFRIENELYYLERQLVGDFTIVSFILMNDKNQLKKSELSKLYDIITNIDLVLIEFVLDNQNNIEINYISNGILKLYPSLDVKHLYQNSERLISRIQREDLDWFWNSMNKSGSEKSIWSIEFRIELENSKMQWVEVTAFPFELENGRILFRGNFSFIDKRKSIETQLHFTQSIYHELFSSIEYGICFIDQNMTIVQANPQIYDILGLDEENLIGKPITNIEWLQNNEFDYPIKSRIYESMMSGLPETIEVYNPVLGDIRKVEFNYYPLHFNEKNASLKGFTFLSDVTEKYLAKKALQESNEIFFYASRAVNEAIWDWDVLSKSLSWGEGITRIFGYEKNDHPKIENWSSYVHWNDYDTVEQEFKKILEDTSARHWNSNYRFLKADGQFVYVSDNAYIIRDEHGNPLRIIGALRDISQSMNSAAEKSLQVNKALKSEREYISMELHDNLGQYLIALNLYLSNIRTKDTDMLKKCMELTQETIKQTRDLCYKITPPELNNGFLKAVQGLIGNLKKATTLKFILEIDEKIQSEDFIYIDEYQNYRIVQEFINNSIKHSKGTQIMCLIYKEKGKINIEICDDGVGFDIDKLETRGFGLNNMLQRAQMSNTKSELISSPGKGTRLHLELNNVHMIL